MTAARRTNARTLLAWLPLALALGFALLLVLYSVNAWARPGGGQSYSGGSRSTRSSGGHSSSGGGGGGDASGLIFQLLLLCIQYPALGVPVLVIVLVFFVGKAFVGSGQKGWSTSTPAEAVQAVQRVEQNARLGRSELDAIRALDPGFSLVLFEDFAYMLYAAVQRARGLGTQALAAYLAPDLAQTLVDPQLSDVQGIVIGAMRYVRFSGTRGPMLEVEIELESNYVEVLRAGGTTPLLRRRSPRAHPRRQRALAPARPRPQAGLPELRRSARSRARHRMQLLSPKRRLRPLRLDDRQPEQRNPRNPRPAADQRRRRNRHRSPHDRRSRRASKSSKSSRAKIPRVNWQALQGRVALIFAELQVAWSGRDPLKIRPFVSDNLFQSMYYWIDLYTQERCRNVTENATIMRIDLANVLSDAYFDCDHPAPLRHQHRLHGLGRTANCSAATAAAPAPTPNTGP